MGVVAAPASLRYGSLVERARGLLPAFPYVLCWGHHVGHYRWEPFELPITNPTRPESVLARVATLEFLTSTEHFTKMLPQLGRAVAAVQLAGRPPDYLDLEKIHGPELWRLLNATGWHVWARIPGNDYGEVASPSRAVVEQAIELVASAR